MNKQPKIAILLSTYNGEKFLAEQLDSILHQTYRDFVLVIRDDCSSDSTLSILTAYQADHPGSIHLLPNDSTNKGASESFSCLLEYVLEHKQHLGLPQAYIMFCDQDDVWIESKIEQQTETMLHAESINPSMPILVHSDLLVVTENLIPIAASLIKFQGLEIQRNRFANIVISNLVTGCTTFINEALALKAYPVSKQAIMHDWWLALVASAFGKLVFMDVSLVRYRQHGKNTIGAKEYVQLAMKDSRRWKRMFTTEHRVHLLEVARQAQEFRERFNQQLSFRQRAVLKVCSCMKIRIGIVQSLIFRLARRL